MEGVITTHLASMKALYEGREERDWWRSWLEDRTTTGKKMVMMPDWYPLVSQLLPLLKSEDATAPDTFEILKILDLLKQSVFFFRHLVSNAFPGRVHCEVSLASLISSSASDHLLAEKDYQEVLSVIRAKDFGEIIGVSKRCCPPCSTLLKFLKHAEGPFHTRGAHNTISACSLPTWLPDHIVAHMNDVFGGLLRRELVNLIKEPSSRRGRSMSTGSSGRSSSDGSGVRHRIHPPDEC
jgi:hypothetical protein